MATDIENGSDRTTVQDTNGNTVGSYGVKREWR
jgi:hypothetical protein